MKRAVWFYSGGVRLAGDVYLPPRTDGERRPGVVLCCGYTGVKDVFLDDMARRIAADGFVALAFDYKGWGQSEGPPLRLAPYGRVEDTQAALSFLAGQPEVNPDRLGLYGISFGGSTAVYTAAIDRRARAVVSVAGVGNGERWMRSVRSPWVFRELADRARQDQLRQATTGESELVHRDEVLIMDPQSAEVSAKVRASRPATAMEVPLEMVHETIGFGPEWLVDRIAPRACLFITSEQDELVLPRESEELHRLAGEPKRLVGMRGFSHYELFAPPAIEAVMTETLAWYRRFLSEA